MGETKRARQKKKNYFIVENALVDRDDLSIYEKAVYVTLCRYANNQTDTAFPSYATISRQANMSRRQAINVVQSLEKKGLIEKKVRKFAFKQNHSNIYTVFSAIKDVPRPSEKHEIKSKSGVFRVNIAINELDYFEEWRKRKRIGGDIKSQLKHYQEYLTRRNPNTVENKMFLLRFALNPALRIDSDSAGGTPPGVHDAPEEY